MKIRLGFIGLCSDHLWPVWGKGAIKEAEECGKYEFISASDKNLELLNRIKNEFGVNRVYMSYNEMLKNESLDAVVIGVPNSEKADVVESVAEKGIHVLIDKPLSANLEQANRIIKSAKKYNIKGMVYYHGVHDPMSWEIYNLVTSGTIGKVFQIEARVANAGPELHGCSPYFLEWLFDPVKNGGGALIDYACYGSLYSRWLIGQPEGVMAVGGRYIKENIQAEDNAVLLLRYPKAVGIIEACWSQFASDTAWKAYIGPRLAVYGSEGSIIWKRRKDETFTLISEEFPEGKEVKPNPLPKEQENAPSYFAECILNDKPVEGPLNLSICRDAQEILEAAYQSIKCKKEIPLPI